MHFHRRTAIVSVALMLIYVATLYTLSSLTPTDGGTVQAQDYPPPSATLNGYPPPAVATPTSPPTNTPVRLSPTPTSTGTPPVGLTSTPPTRRETASPTSTGITTETTRQPTPTSGVAIDLPPTVTRREPAAVRETPGQPAVLSPTAPGTVTPTPATKPAETSIPPETGPPLADLLPPVADRQTGPGTALTLLASLVLAGLAWWVRKRWFTAGVAAGVQNGEDTD